MCRYDLAIFIINMLVKKQNKSKKRLIYVLSIVIIVIIFGVYRKINFWWDSLSWNNYTDIKWVIEKINKIWYSEYFFKKNKSKLLLKNYPKNIDNLIWNNVVAKWEIKNIDNNQIFILKSIKDLDNNIVIEKNIYTFTNELLNINAGEMPWIVLYREWDKIIIYYKDKLLMEISTFECSKVSSSRNCKEMIDDFDLDENEYFNSYNWLVYYKIDENKRIFFNDMLLWYYINTKRDDELLNISSIIEVIDSDYIRDNKKDLLSKPCRNLLNIDDANIIWKEWNILIVGAKWIDEKWNKSVCEVKFDLMNEWEILKDR